MVNAVPNATQWRPVVGENQVFSMLIDTVNGEYLSGGEVQANRGTYVEPPEHVVEIGAEHPWGAGNHRPRSHN